MATPFSGVGGSSVVGPASGGKVYAYNNISTTPLVVAQANPQRTSITFHNPGNVSILVAPVLVQGINAAPNPPGSDTSLTPSPSALGGGWLVPANGGWWTLTGECTKAYQAIALTGTGNPLTVSESNV